MPVLRRGLRPARGGARGPGRARARRSRAPVQPRRSLRQGGPPAADAADRRPAAVPAPALAPRRRAVARAVGPGDSHRGRPPRRDRRRSRAEGDRVLRVRSAHHRGVLRRRKAGERFLEVEQLRHQLAPVHGLGRRRLHADVWRRRPAVLLRGRRRRRRLLVDRHQHRRLPPRALQAPAPPQGRRAGRRRRHRRRSPLDRNRGPRGLAPGAAPRLGRRPAQRDAACARTRGPARS